MKLRNVTVNCELSNYPIMITIFERQLRCRLVFLLITGIPVEAIIQQIENCRFIRNSYDFGEYDMRYAICDMR